MHVGPRQWSSISAILLCAGALLAAAPASADPSDDAFIAALAKQNIVVDDRDAAIATAHAVCAGFDQNDSSSVAAMRLKKGTDLTLKQSSYFVGLSIAAYCPQWKGHTDDSLDWLNPRPPQM